MEQEALKDSNHGYLQSQLLIAMPNLSDPYFKHSVTLICQHDQNGCFGLTVNKPTQVTLEELFEQLDIPIANNAIKSKEIRVLQGGPVQSEQGFVVHDGETKWDNTIAIRSDSNTDSMQSKLSITASRDILFDIANNDGPENYLVILGCASWAPGQMESEIIENSWLNCDVDSKILFETSYEKRWDKAVDVLGFDMSFMSNVAGHD